MEEEIVFTSDPSLTAFGWAILNTKSMTIIDGGCIKTKKSSDKRALKSIDLGVRGLIICKKLHEVALAYPIKRITYEIPVGAKSYQAATSLALVHGIMLYFCAIVDVPFTRVAAKYAKVNIAGESTATKDQVYEGCISKISNLEEFLKGKTKEERYAVADAVAVYLATVGNKK